MGVRASGKRITGPPPLLNMIQVQIDQLPAGLVMVLRCASCLGTAFDAHLLLKVLQTDISITAASLLEQLQTLQDLNFLARVRQIERRDSQRRHAAPERANIKAEITMSQSWQVG